MNSDNKVNQGNVKLDEEVLKKHKTKQNIGSCKQTTTDDQCEKRKNERKKKVRLMKAKSSGRLSCRPLDVGGPSGEISYARSTRVPGLN